MQVNCPECSASLDGPPGEEMVCPACMTPFLVPAEEASAVRAFDVQLADGRVLHGVGRYALREGIYAGRIDREARVRHDGGKWEKIGGYREFAAVFRVLGEELGSLPGTRKLAETGSPAERARGPLSELPRSLFTEAPTLTSATERAPDLFADAPTSAAPAGGMKDLFADAPTRAEPARPQTDADPPTEHTMPTLTLPDASAPTAPSPDMTVPLAPAMASLSPADTRSTAILGGADSTVPVTPRPQQAGRGGPPPSGGNAAPKLRRPDGPDAPAQRRAPPTARVPIVVRTEERSGTSPVVLGLGVLVIVLGALYLFGGAGFSP